MKEEIINNIYPYLRLLYITNKNLIKLCGADAIRNMEDNISTILAIIDSIPRLFPYEYKNNTLIINKNNGILEFDDSKPSLKERFQELLNDNYTILDSVRLIRNRYQHKLHKIKFNSSGSGSNQSFCIEFIIDNRKLIIDTEELINILSGLNIIYSSVIMFLSQMAIKNEYANYLYNEHFVTFDFMIFNEIYQNEMIKKIGRIMFDL